MEENKLDRNIKIHNVRFYNLSPRSINCLAYNKKSGKVALSRIDSSIEIWDISHAAFLEKSIPGPDVADCRSSIEGLGWASETRLFSAGLDGKVVEWDLSLLEFKHVSHVTGNAIWCLDISRDEKFLAVGTEEGYLNIFDISDNNLMYKNIFDKQEGRVLCCKFDESGDFLVTGSLDVIRIWNTKTGHAIRKMTTGRSEAKKETIVWSLQVLKNFTIITGDSRGQVCVWDGKQGVQIESHQALQADVLTVAVNDDENMLICSGVESIIRIFALTTITKSDRIKKKWVKFLQRRVHDHDVKALVCAGLKIISGGVDGYLGISYYSKMHQKITKHGPFLQSPCATVAPEKRFILLRHCNYLEIWHLGKAQKNVLAIGSDDENDKRKLLSLEQKPEKLLQLRSRNDETIISSIISPNGLWLIYSTRNSVRLFNFAKDNEKYKLTRIKDYPEQLKTFTRSIFSQDSKMLILVQSNNQIDIFSMISNCDIDYVETIDASKFIKDVIHLIVLSNCGKYLIVAGTCRNISVWKKTNKLWKHHLNLPKYLVPTTAMALHPCVPKIVVAFTDGKIFEYDLEEMLFTCSDTIKDDIAENLSYHYINILLNPKNEDFITIHNDANLFVLQKVNNENDGIDGSDGSDDNRKKSKSHKQTNENVSNLRVKLRKSYEHFVHFCWLSEDEMVAVNVNPASLIEELPAPLRIKKFGSS